MVVWNLLMRVAMRLRIFIISCFILFSAQALAAEDKAGNFWGSIKNPTQKSPEVYGTYSSGCMDGGVALVESGQDYEIENKDRNRFYGQPALVTFLKAYAYKVHKEYNQTIYVGDMAQARGGPIVSGHGTHQIGLDVDLWYGKTKDAKPLELLKSDGKSIDKNSWVDFDPRVLQAASSFPEVDRIFVNPYIKKELCSEYKGQAWLSKIRPWWAHSDHYHVRLKCPKGSKHCISQAEIEKKDGCDETLEWWFSDDAKKTLEESKQKKPKGVELPEQCKTVYFWKH